MFDLMLTQNSTFILGPIAKVLGLIMAGIFWVLDKIGIPNLGLVIIIFTFVKQMMYEAVDFSVVVMCCLAWYECSGAGFLVSDVLECRESL